MQSIVQVGEKFRLEHAVDKRIRLLWTANHNRKPVIFQVRGTDSLDSADWNRSFGRDDQLIVDQVLRYDVYMAIRLI